MADPKQIYNIIETSFTLAQGTNVLDRLKDAWLHTRDLRENGGCGDDNLAIAEHYLYARYYVADTGYTNYMKLLIFGYNSIKALGLKGLLPETGTCKVTVFSRLDYAWSSRGADDGLGDHLLGPRTYNYDLIAPQPPKPGEDPE
jgi:hypothetical protein